MNTVLLLSVLTAAAIIGVLCVSAILTSARRRPGDTPLDSGACGQCGYSVRGVSELWCPECGADLREVGIDRPRRAGGSRGWLMLFAVTGLAGVALVMVMLLWTSSSAPAPAKPMPAQPAPNPNPLPVQPGK